jgi:hypothetical protein
MVDPAGWARFGQDRFEPFVADYEEHSHAPKSQSDLLCDRSERRPQQEERSVFGTVLSSDDQNRLVLGCLDPHPVRGDLSQLRTLAESCPSSKARHPNACG